VRGKVWKFGNNIDTDAICPTKYINGPESTLLEHVLEVVNRRFAEEVRAGDIIVGGSNFGCGSSRERAPVVLKTLGIRALVADSFARIFFRNGIAIGLPVMNCPGISASFADGDELELDLTATTIINITQGKIFQAKPLPPQVLDVISKGGIVPLLKEIAKKGSDMRHDLIFTTF
jgi:3-isopropylmalate/(R)-2-methylmalate dehydratase small subunit